MAPSRSAPDRRLAVAARNVVRSRGPLGTYRVVDPKAYEAAWRAAAPEHERQALIPEGWFDVWVKATQRPTQARPRSARCVRRRARCRTYVTTGSLEAAV